MPLCKARYHGQMHLDDIYCWTPWLQDSKVISEGHFTPKNPVHFRQNSFCFLEKSIKNPEKSFCSENSRTLPRMSEVPLGCFNLSVTMISDVSRSKLFQLHGYSYIQVSEQTLVDDIWSGYRAGNRDVAQRVQLVTCRILWLSDAKLS